MTDYRTWWRNWEGYGAIKKGYSFSPSLLRDCFEDWGKVNHEFGFDVINIDCAMEQIVAERRRWHEEEA